MPVATGLTARQARFVQEYLVDGRGAQAAIRAGYAVAGARVAAHRALTNAAVSSALQARQSADATRLSIRREDVLTGLLEAVDQARLMQEPMAMVAGLREIARLQGYYAAQRVNVDINTAGAVDMEHMSDADLLAIIDRGAAALP